MMILILHLTLRDSAPCNFADTDTVRAQSRGKVSAALERERERVKRDHEGTGRPDEGSGCDVS